MVLKPILLVDDLFFGIDKKTPLAVVKLLVYIKGNDSSPRQYLHRHLEAGLPGKQHIEIINMEQKV